MAVCWLSARTCILLPRFCRGRAKARRYIYFHTQTHRSEVLGAPARREKIQRTRGVARANFPRHRQRQQILFAPAPFSDSPFLKLVIPNTVACFWRTAVRDPLFVFSPLVY